mgnify:CR=1 FL=1
MKKLLSLLMCGLLLFGCGDKYDDSALRNDLNDLENRVAKLEELCKQMNTNISSLQKIVEALQDNLSISKVEQISDGYIIHFSDGSTATIKNGKNSEDAPIIGVKKDTDGIYYWTLDGEWLTDEKGNKVKAQGTDGKDGVDGEDGTNGKDGITPQLKIENGRWMLSMDNGKTWTDIGQATGADGTDGEDGVDGKDGTNGIFKSVTEDNDNVYFTLEDDSVITIPKSDNSKFAIAFDTTDIAILNGGESKTISYTITDATKNTVVKAIAQDGWKVKVDATSTDKGTITITAPNPIVESEILVFANDGSYRTVMVSLNCMQGQINIADNSINATSAGGTQEIKLTTNLDYTIEIPEDAQSWLSLAPETRALREDTIVFEVTANEGMQRYTTVALKDEQGKILQTIIFRQLGTCTEVHVETKGELENELAGYDYANIESLKITGVLNDVDFLFIYRMMPNLKNLDIAEVNITALPIQAFYKSTNVENLILPNTLITIGEEMFYQSKLKTVVIPANATTIGNSAFEQCASLISIDIPANVETIGTAVFWHYIEQAGKGKYQCFKTKKICLDSVDNDTIAYNYDDKTIANATKSTFAETDHSRVKTVSIAYLFKSPKVPPPIFQYFLDGSRHTFKIDDIGIGKKIFPIIAGQIIVGCCKRKDRDTFKCWQLNNKIVMAMPDDYDDDDGGENFCRSFCETINSKVIDKISKLKDLQLGINKLLLYRTNINPQEQGRDNYKHRGIACIQNEMTDEEQLMVERLCKVGKLHNESWLIKDGSLEYNPSFSNLNRTQWDNLRSNYQHVVGVSKLFDPELLPDFEGNRLSKTIANLGPYERTKVYRYESDHKGGKSYFAVWYVRLRNHDFRETHFSDIVKCEMVLMDENDKLETDKVDMISANLIREAYPVCYGVDTRWANHLYPIFLTESFCKSKYVDSNIILNLF